MTEAWRIFLYPFGVMSSFVFGLRFLIQWWVSECRQKSVSIPVFWKLSLLGNVLLFVHSFFQIHFPMCMLTSVHAVISWRNLNLLQPKKRHKPIKKVFFYLFLAGLFPLVLFTLQRYMQNQETILWIRVPKSQLFTVPEVPYFMHIVGILGVMAYSLRFWFQWWKSEKNDPSELSGHFWWLSILGATLAGSYFLFMFDWVNALGPVIALLPYIRNVRLIKRKKNPKTEKPSIFIFAGETSADLYGGQLLKQWKSELSDYHLFGVGGTKLKNAGLDCIMPMHAFQVMGITAVIKKLPQILFRMLKLTLFIMRNNTKLVLLIDQPAFSMRLARLLRKCGFTGKIVQLVAPSVWAYHPERADEMAKYFDLLLTIFPFEQAYFPSLKTLFVGHPIIEIIDANIHINDKETDSKAREKVIAVFPGSRLHEIRRNLPLQLDAICTLCNIYPDFEIAISKTDICTDDFLEQEVQKARQKTGFTGKIFYSAFEDRYALMKKSALSCAKSGTVTLELALLGVPTVVVYKVSPLNVFVAKYLFKLKLPYFSIVNILHKKEVFPEYIRPPVTSFDVYKALAIFVESEPKTHDCLQACRELKKMLEAEKKPSLAIIDALRKLLV